MHSTTKTPRVPDLSQRIAVQRRWGRLIGQMIISSLLTAIPLSVVSTAVIAHMQPVGPLAPLTAWLLVISFWLLGTLLCGYFWLRLVLDTGTRFSSRGFWRPSLWAPRFIPWSAIQRIDLFLGNFCLRTASHTVIVRPYGFKHPTAIRTIIEAHAPPTALPIHHYAPPQRCPNCQHDHFAIDIGRANRTGAQITRFGTGMLMQRFIGLFFGVAFCTPLVAGLMTQLFPLPERLYTLVVWGLIVVVAFVWLGIRDGLTGTTALRYTCGKCGAKWTIRCGDPWPFEAPEIASS
jgi:hypothetical protein